MWLESSVTDSVWPEVQSLVVCQKQNGHTITITHDGKFQSLPK